VTAPIASPAPTTGISSDTSRLTSGANLKAAGDKFEAVFTGMMLKAMRQAKLADPLFDSKAIDTFSEMQDAQVAKSMAEHTPLGIGRAMTDFLAKAQAAQDPSGGAQPDLNQSGSSPPS
jgi:flagellar protein FlgJ